MEKAAASKMHEDPDGRGEIPLSLVSGDTLKNDEISLTLEAPAVYRSTDPFFEELVEALHPFTPPSGSSWVSCFRSYYKVCTNFMDRMGDLAALEYENFENLMRSSDFMLFAFHLYADMNYADYFSLMCEIDFAAAVTESEMARYRVQKLAVQRALDEEVLENGRDNLIRKMYEFFNTNKDLNRLWIDVISLGRSEKEMHKKNEANCTSGSEFQNCPMYRSSTEISNQEGYKKIEEVGTPPSEVLKYRKDDTISPKSFDKVAYKNPEGYRQEVLKIGPDSLNRQRQTYESPKAMAMVKVNYTRIWASTFRSDYKDCANFMDRMGDLAALKYENFEDLMRSSDSMLLAFTLCKEMNYPGRSNDEACLRLEIEKAASTVESETRKEELRKALEQEVSENGRDQLIRKMYEFFNTNTDLNRVWMCTISLKCSDQEVSKKNETVGTSQSEVVKYGKDDTISLKCWDGDGVLYEMNKAAATSESQVLKCVIEDTGGGDPIPLPFVSGSLRPFIAFLEHHHDLLTSRERCEDCVKDFLNTYWNELADWHELAKCLNIPSLLDLTSLFFCHLRLKVGWQDPCVKSQLEVKRRSDFVKNFRSFEKCSNHFLQVDPIKRKEAISFLRQSAASADIPGIVSSLSGLTLQDVERKMECSLADISECFATLIVA